MRGSKLADPGAFSEMLHAKMKGINAGIEELEPYEFRYCLNNLYPENGGWASVELDAKADIDYRKKYERTYFRNRYFRGQFLMAQKCYRPQMEMCDLVVDTTGAAIWATPETAATLRMS